MPYNVNNITKSEEYDKDADNNEKIDGNNYAKDEHGNFFYPKNKDGDEFMVDSIGYITTTNGSIKYPIDRLGNVIYPTDTGETVYVYYGNKYHIGKDRVGKEQYAKDKALNEFYPPDKSFIIVNGWPVYAKDLNGQTVFIIDSEGNEEYLSGINDSTIDVPTKYAKDKDGNERYPILYNQTNHEYIMNDEYAQNKNNEKYYPIDEYFNEFYISETTQQNASRIADEIILERYAVTCDSKIILPKISNNPYINPNIAPEVKQNDILGELKRRVNHYYDYLTKVPLPNVKRSTNKFANYYYKDSTTLNDILVDFSTQLKPKSKMKNNSLYWWLVLVIAIIVTLLVYGFFFFYSTPYLTQQTIY